MFTYKCACGHEWVEHDTLVPDAAEQKQYRYPCVSCECPDFTVEGS